MFRAIVAPRQRVPYNAFLLYIKTVPRLAGADDPAEMACAEGGPKQRPRKQSQETTQNSLKQQPGMPGQSKAMHQNRYTSPSGRYASPGRHGLDYTRLTFSSILKTPLGERMNRRLKALPRQRRSRVLRRVRLISAMMFSDSCAAGPGLQPGHAAPVPAHPIHQVHREHSHAPARIQARQKLSQPMILPQNRPALHGPGPLPACTRATISP